MAKKTHYMLHSEGELMRDLVRRMIHAALFEAYDGAEKPSAEEIVNLAAEVSEKTHKKLLEKSWITYIGDDRA